MTKQPKPSRARKEINELAAAMHESGTLDATTFEKITMRDLNRAEAATLTPLSPEDIRALREQAHMSQAVFAKVLNLTTGYVSKLERGAERPSGAALVLLNVIRRHGMDPVLS